MIFIDTSYLIALILSTDSKHNRSIELIPLLNEKRIINNVVLTETLNTFTKKNETDTYELYRKISHTHEIVYLKEEDYEDSIRLHSYYNNALNYSDCTILKTMQNKGIYKIASFDEGFDKIKGINRIS